MQNNNLTPEMQAQQDALNLRHELDYQKRRNNTALGYLAGFLIIGTALLILVGFAKYQNAHSQPQNTTIECK
jgi:hypothetical protein